MQNEILNKITLSVYIILVLFIFESGEAQAQTCGFGCLGLGGFYGGYTVQKYDAHGLNAYIQGYNVANASAIKQKMSRFGDNAQGLRLGANIFRTKSDHAFFSVKGFYQFMKEEHRAVEIISDKEVSTTWKLDLNYYGAGADFGLVLGRWFDLKIIEAEVTFNTANLSVNENPVSTKLNNVEFRNSTKVIGYTIGGGFIFHLIIDYVSIEATAGYTNFKADQLENQSAQKPDNSFDSIKNFIAGGGITGSVQMNVGIPLY
ncbi:MAG: hypothetical protein WCJ01_06310 [Ignavibacteria bacterium]